MAASKDFHLNRLARKLYQPGPTTTPALTNWEASFDGGADWVAATTIDGQPSWLVAGPDLDPASVPVPSMPVTVIRGNTIPLIRDVDNPEVVVEKAPSIYLDGPNPVPQANLMVTLPLIVQQMQAQVTAAQAAVGNRVGYGSNLAGFVASLPSGAEYVYNLTDGAGTLLDIVSGVA